MSEHDSQIITDVHAALPKGIPDRTWTVARHDYENQPKSVTIYLNRHDEHSNLHSVHARLAYDMYGDRGVQELAQHLLERMKNG